MKEILQNLYQSNKVTFEFSGAILVIAGLFLNIPSPSSIMGGTSLHYVQFFLLFLACLIVGYLVYVITREILDYILKDTEENNFGGTTSGLQKQIDFLVKKLLMATFLLLVAILILVNLFLFIFDAYTTELFFITLVTVTYFVAYKSSRLIDKFSSLGNFSLYLYIFWMIILVLIFPISLFLTLYLGIQKEIIYFLSTTLETLLN